MQQVRLPTRSAPFCGAARWPKHNRLFVRSAPSTAESVFRETRIKLSDGVGLELISCQAQDQGLAAARPELLFVHGSYHSAWCWKEHFLPFFSADGWNSSAVSLRAQGNSDRVQAGVAGTLDTHARDLAEVIGSFSRPPVVVAHSFSGLILQKYILGIGSGAPQGYPPLAGAAFFCCVPPSGNKELVVRFLKRDPIESLKITWGFVAKTFVGDINAARDLFFSKDIPEDRLKRYHRQLAACSAVRLLDLSDMNRQVPLAPAPRDHPPALVVGAADDRVVDVQAVEELAKYYGVTPTVLPRTAHDCMLDTRWEEPALVLQHWLATLQTA